MPAAVQDIKIQPSYTSARVTWKLQTSASASSYITQLVIYLNGTKYKNISRGTQINIEGLNLFTWYKVEIETRDGSLRKSIKVFKSFKTRVTGKGSHVYAVPSINEIFFKTLLYGNIKVHFFGNRIEIQFSY